MIEQCPLQVAQPALLFDQLLALDPSNTIEPSVQNEAHHLMKLAAIEKRAVSFAHVDDRSREAAEIHSVHELSAAGARPIMNALRRLTACSGERFVGH